MAPRHGDHRLAADQHARVGRDLLHLPGVRADVQVIALDLAGACVSAGAACSSGKVTARYKLNLEEKKIGLSLKAMKEDEPRLEFTSYLASADSGNASMGERLGEQLQRFKKTETE